MCLLIVLARTLQRYDDRIYSRLPYDPELQVRLALALGLLRVICLLLMLQRGESLLLPGRA